MEFVNFMFADAVVSDFVSTAFPIIRAVLLGIVTIACLIMIVTTLLQSSANQTGSSAISGGASDSYFSQNKDNSRDGKLKRITIFMASTIGICVVLYFITGFWLAL
ncbi:MAG: preprotein translocase subunit SecG [Clostridia bacterium]|nr:preprotein translocase subunit SecG [Clostridia bacterium]